MIDVGLALAAAVGAATTATEVPLRPAVGLSRRQMFAWGEQAEARGDRPTAILVYQAMQQDDDQDVRSEARFRLARLLTVGGHLNAAAVVLRQVLDDKPDAARVRLALAELLVKLGDESAARRELRAIRAGNLPADVALLIDRYSEILRVRKPFGAHLELALAPDSNINRATRSDTVGTIIGPFDINDDGKAQSGTGLAIRGELYGRVPLSGDAALQANVAVRADVYRAREFNDLSVAATVGPEFHVGPNVMRAEAGAERRWFGRHVFSDSISSALAITRPVGSRAQVRATASLSLIDNKLNDLQDGRVYSGSIGIERALSPTTGIGLTLSGAREALADPAYSTRSWRASLVGWRDVGRTTFTTTFDYGRLAADDRLVLFPDKRRETFARFSVGASFRQLSVNGFAPLVRYSIERNKSSIEIYDYSRRRTEIGVTRAF